jgi:assimilatory nitrate reductase catalytic subunit
VLRVRVSDTQRPGAVFAPMHWNAQYASLASINALVNPDTDPISGQPEFKHTPARIEPYRAAWYGFLLSRRRLTLTNASYWAVARGDGLWRYEIAGEQAPKDWASCARSLLCAPDEKVEWTEYFDTAETRYRGVRLTGGRIESCIFIAPEPDLPGRDWLQSLFAAERLDPLTRRNLLAGVPPRGQQDAGRIVCACFSVGRNTLLEAIRAHGLSTHEAIGARLKAGTNCGSCIPELKALIAESASR